MIKYHTREDVEDCLIECFKKENHGFFKKVGFLLILPFYCYIYYQIVNKIERTNKMRIKDK